MGNGVGKLNLCFAGDAGEISRRRHDIAVYLSDPLDEGFGHSFCYIRPEQAQLSKLNSDDLSATTFRTISGASISANTSTTPLSTALIDVCPYNAGGCIDKASAFESSDSFASIPLQPIPRNSISSVRSGPIPRTSGAISGSGPIERGFLSGPIERGFISGPLESQYQYDQLQRYKPKSRKWALINTLKKKIAKSMAMPMIGAKDSNITNGSSDKNTENLKDSNHLSSQLSLDCDDHGDQDQDEDEDEDDGDGNDSETHCSPNVQWAQGKAGEDRVHIVISEEHGWVYVGIYDGFNGPDATDYLLNNLYSNVYKELKGLLLWSETGSDPGPNPNGFSHTDVLEALSEGLRKTEQSYLEISDTMAAENPELAMMGSCVLVMLMNGDDLYFMNVGDSRAVLGRRSEPDCRVGSEDFECGLMSTQLTVDHSTSVEEEVSRIKREHRDDAYAVVNDRVKGSLNVTRAFGAGFLKRPKLNNALLEMFRIEYVGVLPYINCQPSLHHHQLCWRDKFLILSSDGLYQYFTNEEAVYEVEAFVGAFPEGDPAQHLVEEVLFRAAKQAGMDFHDLLDIRHGDRRKYHDDVSVIVISFEGQIWRSSSS